MITIAEDKTFLVDQRGPHIGYMAGVDMVLSVKEERRAKRLKRQDYLRSVEDERKRAGTVADIAAELISEEESNTDAGDTVADRAATEAILMQLHLVWLLCIATSNGTTNR